MTNHIANAALAVALLFAGNLRAQEEKKEETAKKPKTIERFGFTTPALTYHSVDYGYNNINPGLLVHYDFSGDKMLEKDFTIEAFLGAYNNSLRNACPIGGAKTEKHWTIDNSWMGFAHVGFSVGLVGGVAGYRDRVVRDGKAQGEGPLHPVPFAAPILAIEVGGNEESSSTNWLAEQKFSLSAMGGYIPEYGALVTTMLTWRIGQHAPRP